MAFDVKITRNIDNNFVQVEAGSKKIPTRYFKVPKENADSFCTSYEKHQKKNNLWTNVSFGTSIILAITLLNVLTKNLKKSITIPLGIFGGIAAGAASSIYCANVFANKQAKMLQDYNAEEITFKDKKLPI